MKTNNNRNYPPPLRGPPPYSGKAETGMKSFAPPQLYFIIGNEVSPKLATCHLQLATCIIQRAAFRNLPLKFKSTFHHSARTIFYKSVYHPW